jgi:hypothetical protein
MRVGTRISILLKARAEDDRRSECNGQRKYTLRFGNVTGTIPLKNALLAFFNPRQARSKAPRGEQNHDLGRDFVITSV